MREPFSAQLRAILRASAHGPVRILLPMLSHIDEIRQARELIATCRDQLRASGRRCDPEIEIGGMIETPAAALMTRAFAAELDFVSIGSNDLIQYLLAVDRQDELVTHLFDPASRAVVETLATIVDGAARAGRPVQLCGELAGDSAFAGLLVGLGLTELSMPPGQLAGVKAELLGLDASAARALVRDWLCDPAWTSGRDLLVNEIGHGIARRFDQRHGAADHPGSGHRPDHPECDARVHCRERHRLVLGHLGRLLLPRLHD
jgi:phosphotransferase system enzyme I (PtsI)